jgi:PAS domain S-box-containing protein
MRQSSNQSSSSSKQADNRLLFIADEPLRTQQHPLVLIVPVCMFFSATHVICALTYGPLPSLSHSSAGLLRQPESWLAFTAVILLVLMQRVWTMRSREREYAELLRRAAEREGTHERRYRELLDNSSDIVYTHDLDGKLITWSKAGEVLTGYKQREVAGKKLLELVSTDHREDTEAILDAIVQGRGPVTFELVVLAKSGTPVTLEVSTRAITQKSKRVGVLGFARDITARKCAEEALKQSELRLRTVVTNVPVILLAFSGEGVLTLCEGKGLAALSLEPESLVGSTVRDLEAAMPGIAEAYGRAMSGQRVTSIQEVGGRVYETQLVPVHENDRVTGIIGIGIDITDLKRSGEEAQRAREVAEAASKAKSEFLANVSHEIRTPMNCILGMTELALDGPLSGEQREYLELVRTSTNSLLTIINDILDFSKVEAGKLELSLARLSLAEVLETTVKHFALRARQKGLSLGYHIAPGTPDTFLGDAGRIRQVLTNLIGNAIKFTETGSVTVRVSPEFQNAAEAVLRFEVVDTGIGIARDKQKVIFDAFAQADGSATRRYGGTGLGLTISRQIVELMDGQIGLESEQGKGSTFYFSLRLQKIQEGLPVPEARLTEENAGGAHTESNQAVRILLVEDNPANQRLMLYMLRKQSYDVTVANNGLQAVAAFEKAGEGGFNLILMDVQMPQMNGFEATAAIREREKEFTTKVPIIALTAHAMKGDRERCMDAGMDGYISKPIHRDHLLQIIEHFAGRAGHPDRSAVLAPSSDIFDITRSLQRAGGDAKLLRELASIFLEIAPALTEEARQAVAAQDYASLDRVCHSLISSLGNFSAKEAFEAASVLERKLAAREPADIEQAYRAVETEVERLKPALKFLLDGSRGEQDDPADSSELASQADHECESRPVEAAFSN